MARIWLSRLIWTLTLVTLTVVAPALAQDSPANENRARIEPLVQAIGLESLLQSMRNEGLANGRDLDRDLLANNGGERWSAMVGQIYDPGEMKSVLEHEIASRLSPKQIDPLVSFFTSESGARIVALELSARHAFADPSVEAASRDVFEELRRTNDPRIALLEEFAELNDLVEMNVSGALNANYAFFEGLNAGGAYGEQRSEADILREIWRQEPSIRAESEVWVYSYLATAYQPLTDDELRSYIDLSASDAGQALNIALFAAFDVLFQAISRDLGMAAAQFMSGQDI